MTNIRLNMLPLAESTFSFKVFRKLKQENDIKEENINQYQLPLDSDPRDRKLFLTSFDEKEGFEEYLVYSHYAIGLTLRFLLKQLINKITTSTCSLTFEVKKRHAEMQVEFTLHKLDQ